MKLMARICFHADKAARGVATLREHGFEVLTHIFPDEPDHLFVEAMRDEDGSEIEYLHEVTHIVEPFDGFVSDAGFIPVGHTPFEYETPAWEDVAIH